MQALRPSRSRSVATLILLLQSFAPVVWSNAPTLSPSQIIEAPADAGPVPAPALFARDLSRDGNRLLLSGFSFTPSGVAYVYERHGGGWQHRDTLPIPDPDAQIQDVALHGNTALITATAEGPAIIRGRLYVYSRAAGDWKFVQRIDEPLDSPGGYAQGALAFDGRTAVVTAPYGDGAAYIYTRKLDGAFDLTATLVEPSPGPFSLTLGTGAALNGNTLLLGATGANDLRGGVFVYRNVQGTWQRVQLLAASDGTVGEFGSSVALSGNTALIGAFGADTPEDDPIHRGAAYVFVERGGQWVEQQKISNPTIGAFGISMDLDGARLAISAHYIRNDPSEFNGIARIFVYEQRERAWSLTAVLEGPQPSNNFALDLDVDGPIVLSSDPTAPTADPEFEGEAYEFRLNAP